ncbi:MAG TPA: hypothetical protein DHV31_00200, partial [Clostridiales bacterium]|nr:hypothetical protein [Clostridiales bacterium]
IVAEQTDTNFNIHDAGYIKPLANSINIMQYDSDGNQVDPSGDFYPSSKPANNSDYSTGFDSWLNYGYVKLAVGVTVDDCTQYSAVTAVSKTDAANVEAHFTFSQPSGDGTAWMASLNSDGYNYYSKLGAGTYVVKARLKIKWFKRETFMGVSYGTPRTHYSEYDIYMTFKINEITEIYYQHIDVNDDTSEETPEAPVYLSANSSASNYFAASSDGFFTYEESSGEVWVNITTNSTFSAMKGKLKVSFKVTGCPDTVKTYELSNIVNSEYKQNIAIHSVLAKKSGDFEIEYTEELDVRVGDEYVWTSTNAIPVGDENATLYAYAGAYVSITGAGGSYSESVTNALTAGYLTMDYTTGAPSFRMMFNLTGIKMGLLPNASQVSIVLMTTQNDASTAFYTNSFLLSDEFIRYNPNVTVKVVTTYNGELRIGEKNGSTITITDDALYQEVIMRTEQTAVSHIREIYEYALEGCSSLQSLSIGAAVSTIGAGALINTQCIQEIGVNEKNEYYVLYKVNPGDPQYAYSGGGLYKKEANEKLTLVAFLGSNTVKEFTLPDECIAIGEYAFSHNTTIETLHLNNVTTIGANAFYGCTALRYIEIPNTIVSIGDNAFKDSALESIYFVGDFAADKLGASIFGENYEIDVFACSGNGNLAAYCADYSDHALQFNVITPYSAFAYEETDDGEIRINKYIGSGIEEIIVPTYIEDKKVTRIGDGVFDGKTDVVTINLPAFVKSIGSYAFRGATSLAELYVNSDPDLGSSLFEGCSSSLIVYGITASNLDYLCEEEGITFNLGTTWGCFQIEDTSFTIGSEHYEGIAITGLTAHECNASHKHIVIPASIHGKDVVEIAIGAFNAHSHASETNANEYGLIESVTIPNSVVKIGAAAFGYTNVKVIRFQGTTIKSITETTTDQYHTLGENASLVVYAAETGSTAVKDFCAEHGITFVEVVKYIIDDTTNSELAISECAGGYA